MSLTDNDIRAMFCRDNRDRYQRLYAFCEIAASAAFLVGWAIAIISHL